MATSSDVHRRTKSLQLKGINIPPGQLGPIGPNKKAERTVSLFFGSSAIFALKDPPLSVPSSRKVWLYRDSVF